MSDTSLYRPTLKKAWQITKRFKSLWILGFFATLLSSGGEYEIITRFFYSPKNRGFIGDFMNSFNSGIQAGLADGGNLWQNIIGAITSSPFTTIMAILIAAVAIAIAVFFIWLGIISQISLIKNISTINKNKKPSLNEGFSHGGKNFWPVFWSNVVLKVALFIIFIIFGSIALLFSGNLWQTIVYFIIFVVFAIGALLISVIFKFQIFNITLNKERFIPALQNAWLLFKSNVLIALETALVLLGVYIVGLFISAIASLILTAGPLFILPLYFSTIAPIAAYIILGFCTVLMIVIIVFVAAFITTFQWAVWTLLFSRIYGGEEESKITRTIGQIQNLPTYFSNKS
ncbi:MAG: hypothetical protein WCV92_00260 [Candidatus Buchananbacteria bacterium]